MEKKANRPRLRNLHSVCHVCVGMDDSARGAERRDEQAVLARRLDETRDLDLRDRFNGRAASG